ncbi:hypothetical protein OkiPb00471_49910 [Escherichia coli]
MARDVLAGSGVQPRISHTHAPEVPGAALLLPVLFVPLPLMPGLIKTELTEEIIRHLFRFMDSSQKPVMMAFEPELHQVRFRWVRSILIMVYSFSVTCQAYPVLRDGADYQMTVIRRRKHKNGAKPSFPANKPDKHFLRPFA